MYVETGKAMGTFLQISSTERLDASISASLRKIFGTVEMSCSRFLDTSDISEIKRNAGICFTKVSSECIDIVKKSLQIAEFTKGTFDPSIGAVSSLWNIGMKNEYIPNEFEIKEAFNLVNYRDVLIDGNQIFLKRKGMSLDLGGIAKEYALHKAARFCEKNLLNSILIDCGGDIVTVGKKHDGSDWRIGISHPRRRNNLIASVNLSKWNTIETSGDYQRFIKKDNFFQSHIFTNKNNGKTSLLSATLVYNRDFDFPLSASACIAGGLDYSKKFLKDLKGLEAVLVTENFDVFVTKNLYEDCYIISDDAKKVLLDL